MGLKQIFFNQWGRLRSGWRFFVFVVLYLIFQFLIGSALFLSLSLAKSGSLRGLPTEAAYRLAILLSALAAGYVCLRLLEGLPWRALGLTFHQHWFAQFMWGSAIGAASLVFAAAIAAAGGGLRFSFSGVSATAIVNSLIVFGALFILAALAEEALFRGYPLQTFTRANLSWFGALITSVLFAAGHLNNPNVAPALTFINTTLAGVWFAVAYMKTRSLWFPLGLHWAWNWALDSILGLPVSGRRVSANSLFLGFDLGPAWLTGGGYGIEGGLAATAALVASTIIVWRFRFVKATPEMLQLTENENAKLNADSNVPAEVK